MSHYRSAFSLTDPNTTPSLALRVYLDNDGTYCSELNVPHDDYMREQIYVLACESPEYGDAVEIELIMAGLTPALSFYEVEVYGHCS